MAVLSRKNDGLRQISTGTSFLLTFLPTLVAVIYALLWTSISQDVLRTEPWSMAAMPGGATASSSLLLDNGMSWKHFSHVFKPCKGGIRWTLLVAIPCNFIGSVVISPLSAGLLQMTVVPTTTLEQFSTAGEVSSGKDSGVGSTILCEINSKSHL